MQNGPNIKILVGGIVHIHFTRLTLADVSQAFRLLVKVSADHQLDNSRDKVHGPVAIYNPAVRPDRLVGFNIYVPIYSGT